MFQISQFQTFALKTLYNLETKIPAFFYFSMLNADSFSLAGMVTEQSLLSSFHDHYLNLDVVLAGKSNFVVDLVKIQTV